MRAERVTHVDDEVLTGDAGMIRRRFRPSHLAAGALAVTVMGCAAATAQRAPGAAAEVREAEADRTAPSSPASMAEPAVQPSPAPPPPAPGAPPPGAAADPADPPAPATARDTQSDEFAGKDADLSVIAHSPEGQSPYLATTDEAPLVVVNIFSDFQCPVCRRSADPIKQLVLDFPDDVKVIFRNNALAMHRRAKPAAIAALAAGRQGKFWQYHDRLFLGRSLDDYALTQIARDLELDLDRWLRDVADPALSDRVDRESESAVQLGADGTPAMFINGVRQIGWGSYRALRMMVERELAKSREMAEAGLPRADIPAERIRATVAKDRKLRGAEETVDPTPWVDALLAE